jgi:hypothetical protein
MSAAALASSPIDRLRHARDWLRRGNHPDLAAVADGLDLYLDLRADVTLDAALGLAPSQNAENWRTAARRQVRDTALRTLADRFMPALRTAARARRVTAMGRQYAIRWLRVDQHLDRMPPRYAGTPDAHLYAAFSVSDGRLPSFGQLRRILRICQGC